MNVTVNDVHVWKERVHDQAILMKILSQKFNVDLSHSSFSFYPNTIYFGTSLTSDPEYTKNMRPVWTAIKQMLIELGWEVYAPFEKTDPHSVVPDGLTSFDITELDHVQVLTREVGLFDINRPSHGAGQEIELGTISNIPRICFSKEKVSRMTKGMPGLIVVNYETNEELIALLKRIFAREHYEKEPMYAAKCKNHPIYSVFKGQKCLICEFKDHLHAF